MSIIPKHFLSNPEEQKEKLGGRFVEVFFIYEEVNLIDCSLCNPLSKKINSNVYWYYHSGIAVVCVKKESVEAAIVAGKQIITENFSSMSAEYLDNGRISLVLDDFLVTTETKTTDLID